MTYAQMSHFVIPQDFEVEPDFDEFEAEDLVEEAVHCPLNAIQKEDR